MTLYLPNMPEGAVAYGQAFFPNKLSKDTIWKDFPLKKSFYPKKIALKEGVLPHLIHVQDYPDKEHWRQLVSKVLQQKFSKVVLARRSHYQAKEAISPTAFVHRLKKLYPEMTPFLLQFSEESAFVGISPEYLFKREGRRVLIDALAGTCTLNEHFDEKHKREFLLVKDSIEDALRPLISSLSWSKTKEKKAGPIKHLYSMAEGVLNDRIDDSALIDALHPTAAMGGMPRNAALEFIREKEPFERGWYASPIGYSTLEKAAYIVAIRSALISGKDLHLFAGAGIVQGSDPEQEWEELSRKMGTLLV